MTSTLDNNSLSTLIDQDFCSILAQAYLLILSWGHSTSTHLELESTAGQKLANPVVEWESVCECEDDCEDEGGVSNVGDICQIESERACEYPECQIVIPNLIQSLAGTPSNMEVRHA